MDPLAWTVITLIAVLAVLQSLFVVSRRAEREHNLIDLRARVATLREEYSEQLEEAARQRTLREAETVLHAPAHAGSLHGQLSAGPQPPARPQRRKAA